MDTPIYNFVCNYNNSQISRFHMPGHKGRDFLGCEGLDITEIKGADVLSVAEGIIAESQQNATSLFRTGATFFVTEGSSQCIKAMLATVLADASNESKEIKKRAYVLAARNVHRAMVDGCALLDLDIEFIEDKKSISICESIITGEMLEKKLREKKEKGMAMPIGVYLTSPDYLGNCSDISELAKICDSYGIPLIVDNAHGAYTAFLEESNHPIHKGAAICCDSAHKTLPALTGAAYIHISEKYRARYEKNISKNLTLFGSTSPSYLILQSLDLCNRYLSDNYKKRLKECIQKIDEAKEFMSQLGIALRKTEPLKIVTDTAASGYRGEDIAEELREYEIECEYADRQYIVLMVTPENDIKDFQRLKNWAVHTKLVKHKKEPMLYDNVCTLQNKRAMTIREAVFAQSEMIDVKDSLGRICAAETVACPPAIPIVISGEVICDDSIRLFQEYDIEEVCVVSL